MVHKTEVESERDGTKHCLTCRREAFRRHFVWYCNCDEIKKDKNES